MLPSNNLSIKAAVLLFLFRATIGPVYSAGLVSDWKPFVIHKNFETDSFPRNILPKKILIPREASNLNDIEYLSLENSSTGKDSPKAEARKSALSKIKVSVSQVNSFMISPDDSSSKGKDEMISKLAKTLPSLFQNPSQETAIQTLKLIEPQVNLGFEF
jgi:hypothetical protein